MKISVHLKILQGIQSYLLYEQCATYHHFSLWVGTISGGTLVPLKQRLGGSKSKINTVKRCETCVDKTLSYSYVKSSLRVPFLFLAVEKIERKNLDFSKFWFCTSSSSFFLSFFSIKHNSKSIYTAYTNKQSEQQTNALLSKIFLFFVRAACELRSTSYDPNTRPGGFLVRHFIRNYIHL